jgi:hypothetical protein
MILKADLELHGKVCHVEVEFTSATKEGVHYFQMIKPLRLTNRRFVWEPHSGKSNLEPLVAALVWLMENDKPKYWSVIDAKTKARGDGQVEDIVYPEGVSLETARRFTESNS